ncbi:hypothetical protein EJB05_35621 [Eragrostis curvula]|uniref:J domain-containing protein n=1 Tax=Eragrostis curvula TaxID=38414 RepID=A0A5J9U8F9_9POAL|nr:hypothetical protein EJB05_35621 [Eragrostis curvula]
MSYDHSYLARTNRRSPSSPPQSKRPTSCPTKRPRISRSVSLLARARALPRPVIAATGYCTAGILSHSLITRAPSAARKSGRPAGRSMGNKPPELSSYHEILRVGRDASPQGFRAAYRSLARQWHPDKHPPSTRPLAEAKFKAITEAYEALLDQQENRAVFAAREGGRSKPTEKDRGGGDNAATARPVRSEKATSATAAATASRTPPRPEAAKNVYSAGSSVRGGGGGVGRRALAEFSSYVVRKAPPLERRLECTLEELCSGCKKEVRYTRDVVTKNGLIAKEEVTKTIRVKPGWRKGTKVTLAGMGDERPGCLAGDAVFVVSEKRHKRFKRLGDDLVLRAQVPLVSALTGWSLSFRLLGGERLRCSFRDEVICPGYVKVVKGGGMPVAGGEDGARGDLRVKLDVVFPENLTVEQRKGLAEILRGCD